MGMKGITVAVLMGALVVTPIASAASYMGFEMGGNYYRLQKKMREAETKYEMGHDYKGSNKLPIIKIRSHATFEKYGNVREGWLHFTPGGYLYSVEVAWDDEGDTYNRLHNALSAKYGNNKRIVQGAYIGNQFRDDDVIIDLVRNESGNEQVTILQFTNIRDLVSVKAARDEIDEIERRRRIKGGESTIIDDL